METPNVNEDSFRSNESESPFDLPSPTPDSDWRHPTSFTELARHEVSFLPMLRCLPNLVAIDRVYHIRGSVTKNDILKLKAYGRGIVEFTLRESKHTIDPTAFLRLVELHNRIAPGPLLPSLHRLHIDNAFSSFSHISLFLTPSLNFLEIVNSSDSPSLTNFIDTLLDEAPKLSSVILGPGHVPVSILPALPKFRQLRRLELVGMALTCLDSKFLIRIGALPYLETFVLDASASHCRVSVPGDPPSQVEPAKSSQQFSEANNEDGPHSPNPTRNPFTDIAHLFPRLRKLHIIGSMGLMVYLLDSVKSITMEDISLTLVWSWAMVESTTTSRGAGLKRLVTTKVVKLAAEDNTPQSFVRQVRHTCARWNKTLDVLYIARVSEEYTTPADSDISSNRPAVLAGDDLEYLLLLSSLKKLKISGWILSDGCNVADLLQKIPQQSIKHLHLPLEDLNGGFTFTELEKIVGARPQLTSFQCRIKDGCGIPEYPDGEPAADLLPHRLEVLSICNSSSYSLDQRIRLARYFSAIFPCLKEIQAHQDHNAKEWEDIGKLVKLCQNAVLDSKQQSFL